MRVIVGMVLLVLGVGSVQAEVFQAGRVLEDNRDFGVRLTVGQVSDFQAMVQETTRRLYDVTGSYWKQDDAEGYDLNDFNIDDKQMTFGISLEKGWSYFSFQFDASYMPISSSSVARRNYYIGVGKSIAYNGEEYDHMKIEKDTEFTFDVEGGTVDTRLLFTPFTLNFTDGVRLVPFLDIGLFGFVGMYEIDAGAAKGVTTYQNPPEVFVIGGQADGILGMGLPQYGGGAELRLGSENNVNLVVLGQYSMLSYDGSTSFLTSSAHREKNAEIDHRHLRLRVYLEFPMQSGRCWMFGLQYQDIQSEGLISSTATDPDVILARQERFDKEVEFGMKAMNAMVGMTF